MRPAVCFLMALCLATAAAQDASQGVKEVIVEGESVGEGEAAAAEALKDAFRKAVEQGCGVFVTSKSEVRDYQLIYDMILTESRGYIVGYEILGRRRDGKRCVVKIKARVSLKELKEDWAGLRFVLRQKGNPKFLVAVVDRVDGRNREGGLAETEIVAKMVKEDVPCVNPRIAEGALKREREAARVAGDKDRLAALARKVEAEVVLLGSVEAVFKKESKPYGAVRRVWYDAAVSIQAVRADDGLVIASFVKSLELGARGCAESRSAAAQKALRAAAATAAEKSLSAVLSAWSRELVRGTFLCIEMRHTTYGEARKMRDKLNGIRFTRDATIDDFSSGVAAIRFRTPYTAQQFLERLLRAGVVEESAVVERSAGRICLDMSGGG